MIVAAYRALNQIEAVLAEDREIRSQLAQAAAQAKQMARQSHKPF